jgi:hypothetical protein
VKGGNVSRVREAIWLQWRGPTAPPSLQHMGRGKGGIKGPMKRRPAPLPLSCSPSPRSPVPLVSIESDRHSTQEADQTFNVNFLYGYHEYKTVFRGSFTVQQLALRMESYLGRYINPDRIVQENQIYRAPSSQEIRIRHRRKVVQLRFPWNDR